LGSANTGRMEASYPNPAEDGMPSSRQEVAASSCGARNA
jgi:hypothetical protein